MRYRFKLRRADLLFYLAACAFLIVHVWIVLKAGLSFPTPWPDEAHFLWQAHAFARHFTLFAPQLNTERLILWMPPGYFVLVGLFFKLVGSSLSSARFLSLLCMVPALIMLLRFLARLTSRWWALAFWGFFIINARFIACSNIARMEALLLLIVTGGFLLIQNGRLTWGLSLLLFAPLVHFNGFLFLVFGVLYALYQLRNNGAVFSWSRWTLILSVLLVLAWVGYGLVAVSHWSAFMHDMAYQFGRKEEARPWSFLTTSENLLVLIILVVAGTYAARNKMKSFQLLFLGLPAWLTWRIGHELWYEVIYHVGFLAASLLLLSVWVHLIKSWLGQNTGIKQVSSILIFIVLLVAWNFRLETIQDMTKYPYCLHLQTMHYTGTVPYITDADKARIMASIEKISGGRVLSVEFSPAADAFAMLPVSDDKIKYICPLFQRMVPDLVVAHYSRHLPAWWQYNDYMLAKAGVTRDSVSYIGLQRSGTESWYVVPTSAEVRAKLHWQH